MGADEKINYILDAAVRVVNTVGFHHATIDSIAAEAQVSKGGVLHYFKSKKQIFLAILDRVFTRILEETYVIHETLPPGPGRMLKAYIMSWIKHQEPKWRVQVLGLLEDEELRERLVDYRIKHYELVLDGCIPELVVQKVLLICSGLWTVPLLARTTPKDLQDFFKVMEYEMIQIIDQAADAVVDKPRTGLTKKTLPENLSPPPLPHLRRAKRNNRNNSRKVNSDAPIQSTLSWNRTRYIRVRFSYEAPVFHQRCIGCLKRSCGLIRPCSITILGINDH